MLITRGPMYSFRNLVAPVSIDDACGAIKYTISLPEKVSTFSYIDPLSTPSFATYFFKGKKMISGCARVRAIKMVL